MTEELKICIESLHMLAKLQNWGAVYKQNKKHICEWKGGTSPQAIAALTLHELAHMGVPVPHPTQSLEEFNETAAVTVPVSTYSEHTNHGTRK